MSSISARGPFSSANVAWKDDIEVWGRGGSISSADKILRETKPNTSTRDVNYGESVRSPCKLGAHRLEVGGPTA